VQHSKIRSRLKAQLTRFTCELTAGLSKAFAKFSVGEIAVRDSGQSGVKLSNIARSLQEEIPLLKTEKTVSRAIYKPKNWKRISGKDCCAWAAAAWIPTPSCAWISAMCARSTPARWNFWIRSGDGSAGKCTPAYWLCSVIGAEVHGSELTPLTSNFLRARPGFCQ